MPEPVETAVTNEVNTGKGMQVLLALDRTAQLLAERWTGWCPNRLGDILREATETDATYRIAEESLCKCLSHPPSLRAWERNRTRDDVLNHVEEATDFLRECLTSTGLLADDVSREFKARRNQRLLPRLEHLRLAKD